MPSYDVGSLRPAGAGRPFGPVGVAQADQFVPGFSPSVVRTASQCCRVNAFYQNGLNQTG